MKAIGPSFGAEILAAGLQGLPFSWVEGEGGYINFGDNMTADQRDSVQAVLNAHDATAKAPVLVPESVTKYQCCVVLSRYGLLTQANAFFDAMPEDDPRRLAWLMASVVRRTSESTLDAAAHLALSEDKTDILFIEASQVE